MVVGQKFNIAIKREMRHDDKVDELLNFQTLLKQTEQKITTIIIINCDLNTSLWRRPNSWTPASLYFHSGNSTLGT